MESVLITDGYNLSISGYTYISNDELMNASILHIDFVSGLVQNQQYTVTISAGISGIYDSGYYMLSQDFEFWFTSKYCPLFTTPTKVRLMAGPAIASIPEDTIYRMILKNSLDAIDLYNMSVSNPYPHNDQHSQLPIGYGQFGCTWENVPMVFRRYVECKTAYDLVSLLKLYRSTMGMSGSQLKTLGDLTISYGAPVFNQYDPNKLKELYDCWNEALRMFNNMKSTVKGLYDSTKGYSHPIRSFYNNRVIKPVIARQYGVYDRYGNYVPWVPGFDGTPGTPFWRTL